MTQASAKFMRSLAKDYECWVIGGLVRKAPSGKGYNQAVVIGPDGEEIEWYNKMHLMGIYNETDRYDAGEEMVTFESLSCGMFLPSCFSACPQKSSGKQHFE